MIPPITDNKILIEIIDELKHSLKSCSPPEQTGMMRDFNDILNSFITKHKLDSDPHSHASLPSMFDYIIDLLPEDPKILKEMAETGVIYTPYITLQISNIDPSVSKIDPSIFKYLQKSDNEKVATPSLYFE